MKNIKNYSFIFILFILFGCEQAEDIDNNSANSSIAKIAENYGYKVEKSSMEKPYYNVKSIHELESILEKSKVHNKKTHLKSIPNNTLFLDKTNEEINLIIDIEYNRIKKKDNSINGNEFSQISYRDGEGDPPYSHSSTFYFDNTFPFANVYITINYNTDSNGNITSAQVISGSWGFNVFSGYEQNNVNMHFQGGSLAFQVQGQILGGLTFGGQSISGGHAFTWTGFIQTNPNGGSAGGFCKQTPNDQTTEADN